MRRGIIYWIKLSAVIIPVALATGAAGRNYLVTQIQTTTQPLQAETASLQTDMYDVKVSVGTKAEQKVVDEQYQTLLREMATMREEMHQGFAVVHSELQGTH